jgi:aryl-alcohol dehydrogenase-like predicted oxidoreductase
MLTGKYSPENRPPGLRRRLFHPTDLAAMQPLIGLMRDMGRPPSEVALNWLLAKGTVPIPGAKNASQAAQNANALGWRLTGEQVAALDAASAKLQH